MSSRVTQADVAKCAGVHVTTVSMALRNHPSIPQKTRDRIQSLAAEMGYRPDPALRALVQYRNQRRLTQEPTTLAYVTNWITRLGWKDYPAHAEFFAGAESRASQLGYRFEHFWRGEKGVNDLRLSNILATRGINGLVIASHRWGTDDEVKIDWPHFSAVKIDFFPHRPTLHNVTNDQRAIIQLAMQRVMSAGYRRIGLVMPRWWDRFVDMAWSAGYLAEQQNLAESDRLPILFFADELRNDLPAEEHDPRVPVRALQQWLIQNRPEVLISYAPFVSARLAELGVSVPRDLAYVDIYREDGDAKTAGVRQNCRRVGELAVEILAGQLQQNNFGLPEFPTSTFVEGTWFDGASLPVRSTVTTETSSAALV